MTSVRKKYSPQEKAKIALESLKGDLTQAELTHKYGVHATQVNKWKKQLKGGISDVFSNQKKQTDRDKDKLVEELYRRIGQLTTEVDWLKKKSEMFE